MSVIFKGKWKHLLSWCGYTFNSVTLSSFWKQLGAKKRKYLPPASLNCWCSKYTSGNIIFKDSNRCNPKHCSQHTYSHHYLHINSLVRSHFQEITPPFNNTSFQSVISLRSHSQIHKFSLTLFSIFWLHCISKGFFSLFLLFISTGEIGNAGNSNKVWAHSAVSNRGWDGIHYQRLQSMCSTPKMCSTVTQGKRADCRLL